MSRPLSTITNTDIVRYFDQSRAEYRWIWGSHRHLGLHCGLVDASHRTHDSAVLNTNRVLADAVDIQPGERVLDAGCGIGGSCIWLAENRDAIVTGANITQSQLDEAEQLVAARGLASRIQFVCCDYTSTGLAKESFDVVWALESYCYAHNKAAFVREAFRLLKPGGRLVIADAFLVKGVESLTAAEEDLVEKWQRGWLVPNMITAEQLQSFMSAAGFVHTRLIDKTPAVVPSSKRMLRLALLWCPLGSVLFRLKLLNQMRWWGLLSGYYQYYAREQGLGIYGVITGTKPANTTP